MTPIYEINIAFHVDDGMKVTINGVTFVFDRQEWEAGGMAFAGDCKQAMSRNDDFEPLLLSALEKWTPESIQFGVDQQLLDATSIRRPDTSWKYTDAAGHEHQWWDKDGPAKEEYRPDKAYYPPTLTFVVDETYYDEEGEEHENGHYECLICGEAIIPRTKADDTQQWVPGIKRYLLNGHPVPMEFGKQIAEVLAKKE